MGGRGLVDPGARAACTGQANATQGQKPAHAVARPRQQWAHHATLMPLSPIVQGALGSHRWSGRATWRWVGRPCAAAPCAASLQARQGGTEQVSASHRPAECKLALAWGARPAARLLLHLPGLHSCGHPVLLNQHDAGSPRSQYSMTTTMSASCPASCSSCSANTSFTPPPAQPGCSATALSEAHQFLAAARAHTQRTCTARAPSGMLVAVRDGIMPSASCKLFIHTARRRSRTHIAA